MHARLLKSMSQVLALGVVAMLPVALTAQAASTAKTAPKSSESKWDIFAGYSYLAPKSSLTTKLPTGTSATIDYSAVNVGGLFSGTYFFNKYVGGQVEVGEHEWGEPKAGAYPSGALQGENVGTRGNNDGFMTYSAGILARIPLKDEHVTPFIHGLVGGAYVGGPYFNRNTWGPVLTAGGGLDYDTPFFNHHLGIRLFQLDYEYMHANFGPPSQVLGGRANIKAVRVSTGVVVHVGSLVPPPPVTLSCSASPESVYPGEPVTITATAENLNPKESTVYTWSGQGVTGNGATATVNTAALTAGKYSAKGDVKQGKKGKEGLKPGTAASCSAAFVVKAFEPPTVSCSASPSAIKPGESSTITAVGVSPQNRPLTYSYTATAGTVSGNGTTATFASAGAPTGVTGITCTVTDDKGQTASAETSVTVAAPYVAPAPKTQALCSITFSKDKKRPTRVDNEAKACLDEVALDLQRSADAKAVVVGNSDAKEKAKTAKQEAFAKKHKKAKVEDYAAQRAVNTKDYLVKDKGIDAARISAATGTADEQKVENYLVPAGASFDKDVVGTAPVSETSVKPVARKSLGKKAHKKAAK